MKNINSKPALKRTASLTILRYSTALIGLGISVAVYYSTAFYLIGDFVYNSDSLYLPALFADVIHGNNLSQWNLPPSSYFFPDMLLYFVVSAFSPSIQIATVAFGIAQYLVFVLGLMLLAKQVLPHSHSALGPGLIALMSIGFSLSLTNLEFYSQMIFVSAHHFGIVLITPFVLTITHKVMSESKISNSLLGILCILSFLATLSDWLYLVQIAVPLAGSLIILHALKKNGLRLILVVATALVVPSLVGLGVSLINVWNHPQLVAYLLRPHPIESSFRQLAASLTTIPPYHAILAIGFLSICAFTFVKIITRNFHRESSVGLDGALLPIYFLVAFAVNFLAVMAAGVFADRDSFRYFLPLFIFSGFWGLPFVIRISKTFKPIFSEWVITGALTLFIFLAWGRIDWQGFNFEYYPSFIQCIDENASRLGIRNGIANYWQARPISLLSQNNLRVVQVKRDLSPYHWINNSAEYEIEPEFAVIDSSFPENFPFRLDENLLTSRFGMPDTTFQCEDNRILVYHHPNDKFRFLFSDASQK